MKIFEIFGNFHLLNSPKRKFCYFSDWLSALGNTLMKFSKQSEPKILYRNHWILPNLICFFQKQEFKSFEIYITEKIQLNNMVLEILISDDQPFENFKLKLKVSDSTSYWIFLKLHALTYIDPNFHFTKTRIWFDRPRRQTNDFVIFNFWLEN